MTNETFLPENYSIPSTGGGYMKFKQGANKFRVMGKAIIGWEYFTNENKPQRFKMDKKPEFPTDIKKDSKVKHFRALPVYSYQDNAILILEITQSSIMGTIKEYIDNPKRGAPTEYDIIVGRVGEGLETEYTVTVDPKEKLAEGVAEAYIKTPINLEALFDNEDPFKKLEA